MDKGKIIFLNGVSSAGKTTLARTLQQKLDEPYYIFNVDMFLGTGIMLPDKFATHDIAGWNFLLKSLSGMHHTVKLYSDMGMNVIVDHALTNCVLGKDPKALEECIALLNDAPVLFVHVTCPLDELRRREKERGDRQIGQAETQLPILVPQETYDLVVDTYQHTTEECSDKIIKILGCSEKHTAFKTLWAQYI
ncbi:MAG: chloramphenicol phosphotransferase CPT family protein [Defluviitaleaceae bacterium]|nr:chloramphenicol phosphotransferase CPT family protein [Defluviitaleaceae bacterium]